MPSPTTDDAGDDAGPAPVDELDAHTRLIGSRAGRAAVALVLAVGGFWIVAPNTPDSPVRARIDDLWSPATRIGLVQDWSVFSPGPRDQSIDVRARIEHDDGTIEFWDVPEFDPFVGAYRQYRWNKWQERVRLDNRAELWDPTARWIAEQNERDGELPARVVLVRRWIDHRPTGGDDGGWNEYAFHVWERP